MSTSVKWKLRFVCAAVVVVVGVYLNRGFFRQAHSTPEKRAGRIVFRDPSHPCGVIAAASVAHLLGRPISLARAGSAIQCDAHGRCSIYDLIRGLQALGFPAMGVRVTEDRITCISLPLILHVHESHFVVAAPMSDDSVVVLDAPWDPARVRVADLKEQFHWKGYAILVAKDADVLNAAARSLGLAKFRAVPGVQQADQTR